MVAPLDLEAEIRRIAGFLDIARSDEEFAAIADACRFENAKKNADRITGDMSNNFQGGNQTFFHQGTNGRWKDVLTDEDLKLYDEAMARLPGDLARWLETGGPATGSLDARSLTQDSRGKPGRRGAPRARRVRTP